jgi:fluoroacetyl-CoA thioesterase
MRDSLRPGLTARLDYTVPPERTVPHLLPESADFAALPPVLATGYLVGIVEWACMLVLDGHLDEGEQTLGVHVDITHQAPTPPGATVTVLAELTEVAGRRLTFSVKAHDDAATICEGTHGRAVIDAARFRDRLESRLESGLGSRPDAGSSG